MARLLALVAALVLVVGAGASAQTAQGVPALPQAGQPRDKAAKGGSASILGRVVAAETGAPVKRARVSLVSTANPMDNRGTTTDLDGRYEFTELAAGSYRVSASKGLHVTLEYGQSRYYDRGKPVELKDGQKAEKIDIALPRGGVLAGVLLDDVGDPASAVRITAMRQQFRGGKRTLVNVGRSVETNDRGEYRLYGLPPGAYFVAALPSTSNPIVPMLSAPGGAPTYYPGTVNEFEAQRVNVPAGAETMVPDFTLVPSRLVKISGTATNSTGGPAQAVMLVSTVQAAGGEASIPGMNMAMVQPDGAFRLNNVAPGEYTLIATSIAGADAQVSSMPLTVAGEDISGVLLTTSEGFTATGQILFDEGAAPVGVTPAGVTLVAAPTSQTSMTGGIGRATIQNDWTFEAKGLAGERRFQFAQGLPAGWMIQSVFQGSTDITDKPLNVRENTSGIVITLTKRAATITGSVADRAGRPVKDCTVVLFPEDAAQGPPHLQRYVRAVRPNDDGTFRLPQLPATSYLIVAVESLEPGDEHDPELLEQLRALATKITLGWGATNDARLMLTPFERR